MLLYINPIAHTHMNTNCSMAQMSQVKYGYGVFANTRTYKTRVSRENAKLFKDIMPTHMERMFMFYNTRKGHMFIACVQPADSPVWRFLTTFSEQIQANDLRKKIVKKEAIIRKKEHELNNLRSTLFAVELPF
jgi:hypothetical protein